MFGSECIQCFLNIFFLSAAYHDFGSILGESFCDGETYSEQAPKNEMQNLNVQKSMNVPVRRCRDDGYLSS